ncbi:MAG: hypothetical protein MI924_14595 [Chloroflexales bacterium]|nr:hypothetical protein [Chloroflexales bacterium]
MTQVEPVQKLTLTWTVSGTAGGSLDTDTGEQVIYTASQPGIDTVIAEGTAADGSLVKEQVVIEAISADVLNIPPLAEIFPQAKNGDMPSPFRDSEESAGSISTEYTEDEDCRNSGPYSLRITFDFRNGGFGGQVFRWESSPEGRFDASQFNEFTFFVKGTALYGFQVGIKDISGTEVKVGVSDFVVVNDAQWKQVVIPLDKFVTADQPVDMAKVRNVNFGFNKDHGSGEICIDDIAFR